MKKSRKVLRKQQRDSDRIRKAMKKVKETIDILWAGNVTPDTLVKANTQMTDLITALAMGDPWGWEVQDCSFYAQLLRMINKKAGYKTDIDYYDTIMLSFDYWGIGVI